MNFTATNIRRFILPLVGGSVLALLFVAARQEHPAAFGQTTAPPSITSVTLTSVTANAAQINASFSEPVESRMLYDTTTAYGQAVPPAPAFYASSATQSFSLASLQPGTTYHYKIEIRRVGETTTVGSADRTFTTKSGSAGGGTQIVISNIVADCVFNSCRISFATNVAANVQLRWDTNSQASFNNYNGGAVGEAAGSYLATNRGLNVTGLNGSTTYHYRLQATDQAGDTTVTNDLTFLTSANATDHVFTTGGCSDGTPIGQCSSVTQGAYCESGGNLVQKCGAQCGFNCSAGQTCNAAQICVVDPAVNPNSPNQCNPPTCYEASGAFKAAAPAGCYSSWSRCTANTILKVHKDRGCNLWLTCGTSVQLKSAPSAPTENLCLTLAACNSLSSDGQCNRYLPQGQCDNDPLRFCSNDSDCIAGGTCNNPDPNNPTRSLQNVTYSSPSQISQIANLSGNIIAGLDWSQQGGANVIQGDLPWQLMNQIGGNAQLDNGDLESSAVDPKPWAAVPDNVPVSFKAGLKVDFEDQNNSFNHVLTVSPRATVQNTVGAGTCSNKTTVVCTQNSECPNASTPSDPTATCSVPTGSCTSATSATTTVSCTRNNAASVCASTSPCQYPDATVFFSGAATKPFTATPSEKYFAQVRVKAAASIVALRVQLGHSGYTAFTATGSDGVTRNLFTDVIATTTWQIVQLGPFDGLSGVTQLAVVCADTSNCNQFQVDDAQVKPVLQITNNPSYLTPSCRLYPKEDSPSCEYTDVNNITYKGWRGYCLEYDSVTGTCLSWWPVDIIKGESGVFGQDKVAGYADQGPLYMCAESAGNYNLPDPGGSGTNNGYEQLMTTVAHFPSDCGPATPGSDCEFDIAARGVSGGGQTNFGGFVAATGADANIFENDIYSIHIVGGGFAGGFDGVGAPTFLTKDSTFTQGCGGILANRPWSACWSSEFGNGPHSDTNQPQFFSIAFSFDQATGQFKGVFFQANDGGSQAGSLYLKPYFVLKEQCTKLVQVVTPSGQTQPFVSRVASSAYKVPSPVGYTRSTDLTPFGSSLPPANQGSEPDAGWSVLSAEKPNYSVFEAPGQARSGTPYACVGDCSKLVCNIDPNNDCSTSSKIQKCQSGTTINGNDVSDINGDGVGDGQCVGVTAGVSSKGVQAFDPNLDPATIPSNNPLCSVTTQSCTKSTTVSGTFSSGTSDASALAALTATCKNTVACSGTTTSCAGGTTVKYSGANNLSCSTAFFLKRCTATCTIAANATYQQAQAQVSNAFFSQQYIRRLFTRSYGMWALTNGTYQLVTNSKLDPTNAAFVGWGPPTEICPKGADGLPGRPSFPYDYCAVPPRVIDDANTDQDGPQFLSGTARTTTITGGSGTVGIKFNTNADPDQLPLKNINIDWGDNGSNYETFAYPFAPRTDPSQPHIFSHVYVMNPANPNCQQVNSRLRCTYPIRIQVEDNWGWCNNAKKLGDADVPDATDDDNGCAAPTSQWYNTGLTVNVEP